MKITINKEYTAASQLDAIKEKTSDFKAYFTEGDLLRMFTETAETVIYGEIIKCEVEAFAANYHTDEASFHVQIIVDSITDFHRIRFFIDEKDGSYIVNSDDILLTHEQFRIIA